MFERIAINIELYYANIQKLNAAVSDINGGFNKYQAFDQTNINPFKEDLENMVEAIQLLNKYKAYLQQDVDTLRKTGDAVKKKDEELARDTTYQLSTEQL